MAAAPFKAVLVLQGRRTGMTVQYPCTVSDVNTEYYIFPDAGTDVVLPATDVWGLVDVVLSAAGTDTTRANIFVNGKNTGEQIMNAANLGTNFSRQFNRAPIYISGGSKVKIQQIT